MAGKKFCRERPTRRGPQRRLFKSSHILYLLCLQTHRNEIYCSCISTNKELTNKSSTTILFCQRSPVKPDTKGISP